MNAPWNELPRWLDEINVGVEADRQSAAWRALSRTVDRIVSRVVVAATSGLVVMMIARVALHAWGAR